MLDDLLVCLQHIKVVPVSTGALLESREEGGLVPGRPDAETHCFPTEESVKFSNGTVQGQRGSLALQTKGIARRRTPVLARDDNLKLLAMMSRALYLTVAVPATDSNTQALTLHCHTAPPSLGS